MPRFRPSAISDVESVKKHPGIMKGGRKEDDMRNKEGRGERESQTAGLVERRETGKCKKKAKSEKVQPSYKGK